MSQFISRAAYDEEPDTSPIWRTEAFVGAFGDAFVRDSGLEGGQTCNSMDMVADLLQKTVADSRELLSFFEESDLAKLATIRDDLKAGAALDREQLSTSLRVRSTTNQNTVSQDVNKAQQFLVDHVRKIEALKPGQRLVVPGGWSSPTGGHAVIYIVFCDALSRVSISSERAPEPSAGKTASPLTNDSLEVPDAATTDTTDSSQFSYSFATCNTGDGVNYHPRIDCEYYPKSKHQCAILFRDVPRHRLIEKSLWYMLFKMKVTSDASHGPEMLYEVLLPHLCGNLVYTAVSEHLEENGHWETIQRSGTCFMRSILTCLRFLLKRDGFSHIQQKQLFVALRIGFLDLVAADLDRKRLGPDSANLINESDIKLIEVACNQSARAATKLVSYEDRLRRMMSEDPADAVAAATAAKALQNTAAAAAAAAENENLPGRVWAAREDVGSIESLQRAGHTTTALSSAQLEVLEDKVADILSRARQTLANFQFKIEQADELCLDRTSAGLGLFPGFDLVVGGDLACASHSKPDPGPASDARPDPFSNTKTIPAPTSARSFSSSLRECIRQCVEMRTTSSSAGTLAVLHQIVHAVQMFVQRIPFPRTPFSRSTRTSAADADEKAGRKDTPAILAARAAKTRAERAQDRSTVSAADAAAAALWQDIDDSATVRFQRTCVQLLQELAVQYLSACHSVAGDRSDDAKRQVTIATLVCLADRILRIDVLDGLSEEHASRIVCAFGCAYLPLTLALNGVPFRAEDVVNVASDDSDTVDAKVRRLRGLFHSSDAKPYRLMTKTMGEQEFSELASGMIMTSPLFARLLGSVLRYLHQLQDYEDLFSMKAFAPFMLYDKSNTKKFLDLLLQHCQVANAPPGSKQTDPLQLAGAGGKSPRSPEAKTPSDNNVIVSSTRAMHLQEVAKRYSHMKPVEKCATWMAADWDGVCPDFNAYRDLHFLFRIGLEPARAFRVCNPTLPRLWYTTHVKPAFHIAYTNPEGDFTIMQLTYARHAFGTNPFIPMPPGCIKPLVAGTQILPSLGHPARYLLNDDGEEAIPAQSGPSTSAVGVDEDTVLVASKLETFDDCLSEEDAELLLSILSAPYLSIPLLLHYFSENRVSQIAHSRIQNLLESVLFEPKSIARGAAGSALPTGEVLRAIETVPVPEDARATAFGTSSGALLFECMHAPDSLLLPLTKILDSALILCVGGDRSFFAPLLLFLIRTACRVLAFYQVAYATKLEAAKASAVAGGQPEDSATGPASSAKAQELQRQLQVECLQRLCDWKTAAFKRGDIRNSVKIHAHMILVLDRSDAWRLLESSEQANVKLSPDLVAKLGAAKNKDLVDLFEVVQFFLSSAAFVVHWHVHDDPSKDKSRGRGRRNLAALGTAAAAAQRMRDEATEEQKQLADAMQVPDALATSDTPIGNCFAAMDSRREQILLFTKSGCSPLATDHAITNMVHVALRKQALPAKFARQPSDLRAAELNGTSVVGSDESAARLRRWIPLTSKPLSCTEIVESAHPYCAGTDRYWVVSFPNSPHISISFDSRTSTEEGRDYIEFFKDNTYTERWGAPRYSGGTQREWPGASGRAPLLIPADSVVVHFHSDDSIEDWGFRIIASAPVNQDAVPVVHQRITSLHSANAVPVVGNDENIDFKSIFTNRVCERALAQTRNSVDEAVALLVSDAGQQLVQSEQLQQQKSREEVRGLYKNSSSAYFVNIQTAEVFFENRLLMPTPMEVASHGDFRDVFHPKRGGGKKGRSEMPYCTLVSKTKFTQHIKIIEGAEEFDVIAWTPLASHRVMLQDEPQDGDGEANDQPSGPSLSGVNFPVVNRANDKAHFCGRHFERVNLDEVMAAKVKEAENGGATGQRSKRSCRAAGEGLFEDLLVEEILSNGLDELPDVYEWRPAASKGTNDHAHDPKLRWLLMFVQPDPTAEELKNHPGSWFEIKTHVPLNGAAAISSERRRGIGDPKQKNDHVSVNTNVEYMLSVYELMDFAHECFRSLVYTSDHRFALADLPVSSSARDSPAPPAQQYAAGKFFGSLFAYPGHIQRRAGVGKLQHLSVYSVAIRRKRTLPPAASAIEEWSYEELVPDRLLVGLLPASLLREFQMWRTGPHTLRGYNYRTRAPNCFSKQSLLVEMITSGGSQEPSSGHVSAVVRLLKPVSSDATNAEPQIASTEGALALFNFGRCRDAVTGHLARLFAQVDSVSHVLAWSESVVTPKNMKQNNGVGNECHVTMVQLPRLGATFHVRRDHTGAPRLSSAEYAGLFVRGNHPLLSLRHSDNLWSRPPRGSGAASGNDASNTSAAAAKLLTSMPKFLELQDSFGQSFVFLPNFGQRRLEVRECPFSTSLVFDKSYDNWSRHVDARFYVYPVHISGAFFLFPSIASSLYMILQHMMHRDYVRAARVIAATNADRVLSDEARWVMGQFQAIGKDSHPHAHACRLKLAIMCHECSMPRLPWEKDMKLVADYEQYLLKVGHVVSECRLSLLEEAFLISTIHKVAVREKERKAAKKRAADRERVAQHREPEEDDSDAAPAYVTLRANFLHAQGARIQLDRDSDPAIRAKPVHMDGVYQPTVRSMGGLALLQYEYRVSAVAVANEDCTETVSAMQRLGNFGAGSDASGTAREILRYERPHPRGGRLTGTAAFNLLMQLDSDRRPVGMSRLTGSVQSDSGFCFLYELLTGQAVVDLGLDEPSSKKKIAKRKQNTLGSVNEGKNPSADSASQGVAPMGAGSDCDGADDDEDDQDAQVAMSAEELEAKYQDVADMGFGEDDGWKEVDVKRLLKMLKGDVDGLVDLLDENPSKAKAMLKSENSTSKKRRQKKSSSRVKIAVHSISGVTHVLVPLLEPFSALQEHLVKELGYKSDDIKQTFLYKSKQSKQSKQEVATPAGAAGTSAPSSSSTEVVQLETSRNSVHDDNFDDGLDEQGRWNYVGSSVADSPPLPQTSTAKDEGLQDGDKLFFRVVVDSTKTLVRIARAAGYNVERFHCDILLDMVDNELSIAEDLLTQEPEKALNAVQKYQIFSDRFPNPSSDKDERPHRYRGKSDSVEDADPAPSWILAKLLVASYLCKTTDNFKQFNQVQEADNQLYGVLLALVRAREEQYGVILQAREGLGGQDNLAAKAISATGPAVKSRMAEEFPMLPYEANKEQLSRTGVRGFMESRTMHEFWKSALRSALRFTRKNLREAADVDLFSEELQQVGATGQPLALKSASAKLDRYLRVSRWVLKGIFFHIPADFRKRVLSARAAARAELSLDGQTSQRGRQARRLAAQMANLPLEIHGRLTLGPPGSLVREQQGAYLGGGPSFTPDLSRSRCAVQPVAADALQKLLHSIDGFAMANSRDSSAERDILSGSLSVSLKELEALCSVPLGSDCDVDKFVTLREAVSDDIIAETPGAPSASGDATSIAADIGSWTSLPFDLAHLKSGAAINILHRMNADLAASATGDEALVEKHRGSVPELACLPIAQLEALIGKASAGTPVANGRSCISPSLALLLQQSLVALGDLESKMNTAQQRDYDQVQSGIAALETLVRSLGVSRSGEKSGESEGTAIRKAVWRLRGLVNPRGGTFSQLAASVASMNGIRALQRLNGNFMTDEEAALLQHATTVVLLKTIRRAQIMRVVAGAIKLRSMIEEYLVAALRFDYQTIDAMGTDDPYAPVSVQMIRHALTVSNFDALKAHTIIAQARGDIRALQAEETGIAPRVVYALFHVSDFSMTAFRESKFGEKEDAANFSAHVEGLIKANCCFHGHTLVMQLVEPASTEARIGSDAGSVAKTTAPALETDFLKNKFNIIKHTAQKLAREILSTRAYTNAAFWTRHESQQSAIASTNSTTEAVNYVFTVEPRFLLFEFITGFLLRQRQCELISDFLFNYRKGQSCVFQMIMGAGKTAVIGPLLALILANGRSLVTQVCPAALLDMTMSVMRHRFSSIIVKPVLSFKFDRGSDESNSLEAIEASKTRLKRAIKERSVVCATPASIKSLLLKYIDLLFQSAETPRMVQLSDSLLNPTLLNELAPMRSRCTEVESMADHLAYILGIWRSGVALLDEVDLLLHPLKSELNFPIGKKVTLDLEPHRWTLPFYLLDGIFEGSSRLVQQHTDDTENNANIMGPPVKKMLAETPSTAAAAEYLALSTPGGLMTPATALNEDTSGSDLRETAANAAFFADLAVVLQGGVEDMCIALAPHFVLLDPRFYHSSIKPLMAHWAAQWLVKQPAIADRLTIAHGRFERGGDGSTTDVLPEQIADAEADLAARDVAVELLVDYLCGGQARQSERGTEAVRLLACVNATPRLETEASKAAAVKRKQSQDKKHAKKAKNAAKSSDDESSEDITDPHDANPVALVNLAAEWVQVYLPHVLSKINRVSYGLLATDGVPAANERNEEEDSAQWASSEDTAKYQLSNRLSLAVPFVGKDVPSTAAEFACAEVLIGLTVLSYRYEGMRVRDAKILTRWLKDDLMNESGPFAERPTRIKFEDWKLQARGSLHTQVDPDKPDDDDEYDSKDEPTRRSEPSSGAIPDREADTSMEGVDADDPEAAKLAADAAAAAAVDEPPRDSLDTDIPPLELLHYHNDDLMRLVKNQVGRQVDVIRHYLCVQVFPRLMKQKLTKFSASGVDLGGKAIFGTRLGFSGTPSDLLPLDLRPCVYEKGSEAQVVRTLADPSIVDVEILQRGWTVDHLLRTIAKGSGDSHYQALIDTGALITGLSNIEVARKMLEYGLDDMDGCVFLDDEDKKMVLMRTTEGTGGQGIQAEPVPLATSGVAVEKRFTFYDQVHTTGMDIPQPIDGYAVATIGKDMTLRDFSQGCWRMRDLGQGQRVHVVVPCEVEKLMKEVANTGALLKVDASPHAPVLRSNLLLLAWLTQNGVRSEEQQAVQLREQNIRDVARRMSLGLLLQFKKPLSAEKQHEAMVAAEARATATGGDPTKINVGVERDRRTRSAGFSFQTGSLVVARVRSSSIAYQNGLRDGLRVVAVDGHSVATLSDYRRRTASRVKFTMTVIKESQDAHFLRTTLTSCTRFGRFQPPVDSAAEVRRIIDGLPPSLRRSVDRSFSKEADQVRRFIAILQDILPDQVVAGISWTELFSLFASSPDMTYAEFREFIHRMLCQLGFLAASVDNVVETAYKTEQTAAEQGHPAVRENKLEKILKLASDDYQPVVDPEAALALLQGCLQIFKEELSVAIPSHIHGASASHSMRSEGSKAEQQQPSKELQDLDILEKLLTAAENVDEIAAFGPKDTWPLAEYRADLAAAMADKVGIENDSVGAEDGTGTSSSNHDREIVQEQEKEKQQLQQAVVAANVKPALPIKPEPWSLSKLLASSDAVARELIGENFYPLSFFKMAETTVPLEYPAVALISEHHSSFVPPMSDAATLKDAETKGTSNKSNGGGAGDTDDAAGGDCEAKEQDCTEVGDLAGGKAESKGESDGSNRTLKNAFVLWEWQLPASNLPQSGALVSGSSDDPKATETSDALEEGDDAVSVVAWRCKATGNVFSTMKEVQAYAKATGRVDFEETTSSSRADAAETAKAKCAPNGTAIKKSKPGKDDKTTKSKKPGAEQHNARNVMMLQKVLGDAFTAHQYDMILFATGNDVRQAVLFIQRAPRQHIYQAIAQVEAALQLHKSGGVLGGKGKDGDVLRSKREEEYRARRKQEKQRTTKAMRDATQPHSTFLVLVSLEEAETLRRGLIAKAASIDESQNDKDPRTLSGGGRLLTLEGTVLFDASSSNSCSADSDQISQPRSLARQPSLVQPSLQRTQTLDLVAGVDDTNCLDEVRQCFRFFNCNLWYEEKDLIALLRALRHTDRISRRQHFEAVSEGRARRSRQEWAHTSVAAVFSEDDEERRVRLLKATIQMQRQMLRKHGSIAEAFVALTSDAHGGGVPIAALEETFGASRSESTALQELLLHLDGAESGAISFRIFMAHFGRLGDSVVDASNHFNANALPVDAELLQPAKLERVSTLQLVEDDAYVLLSESSSGVGKPDADASLRGDTPGVVWTEARRTAITDVSEADLVGDLRPLVVGGAGTLTISNDQTIVSVPTPDEGSPSHIIGRGVLVHTGAHYYEVSVVGIAEGASCIVGWAQGGFRGYSCSSPNSASNEPCHPRLWGLDAGRGCTVVQSESIATEPALSEVTHRGACQRPVRAGDTLGIYMDAVRGVLAFTLNGVPTRAVVHIPIPACTAATAASGHARDALVPCISVSGDCQLRVNFGTRPFSDSFTGYFPAHAAAASLDQMPGQETTMSQTVGLQAEFAGVHAWICARQENLVAHSCGGRFGKLVPTSGSTGLVITGRTATFQNGFPSCKLAGVLLTCGQWYYEVKILKAGQAVQLGWCDLEFHGSSATGIGVGDDKCSWAFDGVRAPGQGAWHMGPLVYGRKWKAGDVVGCAVDLDAGTISYSLNGDWASPMGTIWTGISFRGGLAPALTSNQNFACVFNWGSAPGAPGSDSGTGTGADNELEGLLSPSRRGNVTVSNELEESINVTTQQSDGSGQGPFAFSCPEGYSAVGDWLRDHDPATGDIQPKPDLVEEDATQNLEQKVQDVPLIAPDESASNSASTAAPVDLGYLDDKYQDLVDMGFSQDEGWPVDGVKKLLHFLEGDVDATADMLADEPQKARQVMQQPLFASKPAQASMTDNVGDVPPSNLTIVKAVVPLNLKVASGFQKVLCGPASAHCRNEIAAAASQDASAGGSKDDSESRDKAAKVSAKDAEAKAKAAARKEALARDKHVARFVALVPSAQPTVVVAAAAPHVSSSGLSASPWHGVQRGACRFDLRLRQNLRRNEWVAAGWCRMAAAGRFDWSREVTVGRSSQLGSGRASQSVGLYLYGDGRIVFRASAEPVVTSSGPGAESPVEEVDQLHGPLGTGSGSPGVDADDNAAQRIAAYAKAGTIISCLLDLDKQEMYFSLLDEDRRRSAASKYRVRATKTYQIPEGLMAGVEGDSDGFTAAVSGMGRTPVAGDKDDVFDEDVADQAVFSCAVLLSEEDLAESVPAGKLGFKELGTAFTASSATLSLERAASQ